MSSQPSRIEVWTVEDSEDYRNAIVRVLNSLPGIQCSHAFMSSEEAIEAIRQGASPRVLLLDIHLPGKTGLECIQEFKTLSSGTDIIMLTVINDHASVMQALCAGATGFLLKTEPMEAIREAVFEVVKGGAPMTSEIARSVLQLFVRYAPGKVDYGLSKQETNVLELLVDGKVKKEVAENLGLSYHTVDNHVRGIYRKLHVHSLSAAVAKAVREKLF